jgi:hypothetical protein
MPWDTRPRQMQTGVGVLLLRTPVDIFRSTVDLQVGFL